MVNYWINPQLTQQYIKTGVYCGEVVDNRDPEGRNRPKVWVYPVHGDFNKRKLNCLPWAEINVNAGSQPKFEFWELVRVTFDQGDPDFPIVHGRWSGNPDASGQLPRNSKFGTDMPMQSWGHRGDLTPEASVIGYSHEGSAVYIEEKQFNDDDTYSTVALEDAGGKYFRIKTYHKGKPPADAESKPEKDKDLYKVTLPELKPLRTGFETEFEEGRAGAIEFGTQNVERKLITDAENFSVDLLSQKNSDDEWDLEIKSIAATMHIMRQGNGGLALADSSVYAMGDVFMPGMMSVPEAWTESEDATQEEPSP